MAKETENYEFDDTSVKYASLTDEEAKTQVQRVKDRIKEIRGAANLSDNPQMIFELRELHSALAWYKANKNRSRYFKVVSSGASMRKAKRHPDGRSFRCGKPSGQKR